MSALVVSTECPTCAAPLDFAHASTAVRCLHCRSSLLVTGHKQVLSYHVAPALDAKGAMTLVKTGFGGLPMRAGEPRLYFVPYYRLTGHEFRWLKPELGRLTFEDRYLDRSFLAVDLPELHVPSLGVRTSVVRLQLFRRTAVETLGHAVAVEMTAEAALGFGMDPIDEATIRHRTVLGRVLSVLYVPFWIVPLGDGKQPRLAVVDAVAQSVVTLDAPPTLARRLERTSSADAQVVGFRPLVCPNCGWDLPLRPDDVVFFCAGCERAWQIRGDELLLVDSAVADLQDVRAHASVNSSVTYLPCWVLETNASHEGRLFVPGFRFQRLRFLADLTRRMTAKQPSYSLIAGPRPELHGCYYDVEDAILLGRFVRAVDAAGAGFTVTRVTLTWFPFATDRHELIDPFSGLALPANPLL